ncbi:gamma-butyrobetaine hydroxylase-like domain-containing protein [Roseibium algae]|uniref:gamma-butyrobetaine hydroxylase-like domain-containing protein n=1 Tax=Roseibium algae TaxID=3123038 RepID=UPI003BF56DE0
MSDQKAWPTEIRLKNDKKTLFVSFDSCETHEYSAEYLRVCSPSAEVQGHNPSQKKTIPGKIDVGIMKIEPVGNYAVRIHFDDLHNTGIYTWNYFLELAHDKDKHWGVYVKELEEKGLTRER